MASIDRSDPVILGHLLAEHRDLFNLIQSVRKALATSGEPPAERRAAILESLRSLRCHLKGHFAQEESGGFLEEAVTRIPRLSAAMRSIIAQHPDLLVELDGVIAGLDAAPASAAAWESAGRNFERFADHMTAHEQRENAVVQEGYCEDLGLCE
jgi:iron-sulfur cluster repair protein YtfE (RIC family)